jgi:hypothetical protein
MVSFTLSDQCGSSTGEPRHSSRQGFDKWLIIPWKDSMFRFQLAELDDDSYGIYNFNWGYFSCCGRDE